MELKIDGIVVDAKDYKDNDKLLTILTANGKLFCKLVGCKRATSKLKNVGQPFCFAEFIILNAGKNNAKIINANIKESFYEFTLDYDIFNTASIILKSIQFYINDEENDGRVFLYVLKALLFIKNYPEHCIDIVNKFLINYMAVKGYKLNTANCIKCGERLKSKTLLDMETGEISCEKCSNAYEVPIVNCEYLQFLKSNALEQIVEGNADMANAKMFLDLLSRLNINLK